MDTIYGKPNPSSGLPVEIYDLTGTGGGTYAEAAAIIGWDGTNLVWRRVAVDTKGQLIISNPGSGGSGGGGGVIQVSGTDGSATNVGSAAGNLSVPVSGAFTISTATVVQGTASNLNVTAVEAGTWSVTVNNGTVTSIPSGTQSVTGTVAVTQSTSPWVITGTTTAAGTTPVSGTVTAIESGTWSVTVSNGTITNIPNGTQTITGSVAVDWQESSSTSTAWTSSATLNSTIVLGVTSFNSLLLSFNPTAGVTGGEVFFEASNDNGVTWYTISGQQNGNSGIIQSVFLMNSVAVTWLFNIAGFTNFRVRLNPVVTGTGTATFLMQATGGVAVTPVSTIIAGGTNTIGAVLQATSPWIVGGTTTNVPSGTQSVAGTVTITPSGTQTVTAQQAGAPWTVIISTETTGGASMYSNLNLGNTGTAVKSSAASLYGYYFGNNGTGSLFVRLYNVTTAPTSTDTPVIRAYIPPSAAANLALTVPAAFTAGLGIRATTAQADNDTTAPGTDQAIVNVFYA